MNPEPTQDEEPEHVVVMRLFRCLKSEEQDKLIKLALLMLGRRCSLNPLYRLSSTDDLQEELKSRDLDEKLQSAWPGGWPGQAFVDLDNVGDPSAWLREHLGGRTFDVLFGRAWDEGVIAHELGEDYLRELVAAGYPLPSEFAEDGEDSPDDDLVSIESEFAAFLLAWREHVLVTLEKQNDDRRDAPTK